MRVTIPRNCLKNSVTVVNRNFDDRWIIVSFIVGNVFLHKQMNKWVRKISNTSWQNITYDVVQSEKHTQNTMLNNDNPVGNAQFKTDANDESFANRAFTNENWHHSFASVIFKFSSIPTTMSLPSGPSQRTWRNRKRTKATHTLSW